MFLLPKTWLETDVQTIASVVGGGTPDTKRKEFWQGSIPWISSADIDEVGKIAPRRHVTDEALNSSAANMVPVGSIIVVTRVGLGKVAIAPQSLCFSQDSQALIFNPELINPPYLAYYLRTAVQEFKHVSRGTTISGVTKKQLLELPVVLAPIDEQHRIVAEIETQFTRLDAAVAALERARANLKRYRAAVLRTACQGRLVPREAELARMEDREYEPAEALLKRILNERRASWEANRLAKMRAMSKLPKDDAWKAKYVGATPAKPDELPTPPEGWAWARAEQICDFITKGTTPAASKLHAGAGDIPFIKVYNLTFDGRLDFSVNPTFVSTDTHKKELARSRVVPGDVLMNIVGPPLGKVSVVPDTFDEWNMNQAVAVFRPLPGVLGSYLAICLLAGDVLNWAVRRAKATAGQFNLTLEICRDLPLPIPPAAEQARIVVEAERRLSLIDGAEAMVTRSLKRADRLRQAILKQAFEGRLVDQDPNDEPAIALLERIGAERKAPVSSRPFRLANAVLGSAETSRREARR